MENQRVFVIEDERRDWGRRIAWGLRKGERTSVITRRYLMLVKDSQMRKVIEDRFKIEPYCGNGKGEIFYCVALGSSRRRKDFIKSLLHFFRKYLGPSFCDRVEVLEGLDAMKALMEAYIGNGHLQAKGAG